MPVTLTRKSPPKFSHTKFWDSWEARLPELTQVWDEMRAKYPHGRDAFEAWKSYFGLRNHPGAYFLLRFFGLRCCTVCGILFTPGPRDRRSRNRFNSECHPCYAARAAERMREKAMEYQVTPRKHMNEQELQEYACKPKFRGGLGMSVEEFAEAKTDTTVKSRWTSKSWRTMHRVVNT